MKTNIKNLIIGSNSFLGRALSMRLSEMSEDTLGVYHRNTQHLFEGIVQIPISELKKIEHVENVYLVSAFVPTSQDKDNLEKLEEVNVGLVIRICEMFPKARIIYCSSVSVYEWQDIALTEKSEEGPQSEYGESKLKGESIIKKHASHTIVRISSMYGPNMKTHTLLPVIVKQALSTSEIILYGKGNRKQNYIYVDDVANYLIAAANFKENVIFLACAKHSFSNKELATKVASELEGVSISYEKTDSSHSFEYDNTKTRETLGIEAEIGFNVGLKNLIAWIKKQ